ncbi:MAG: DUF72 domain-containing protein [Alkalibacterium sp.]|nr:DUF72 domain-containing protein [Alkalibacterium sp.]
MITIGLTGWSDHELIQRHPSKKLEDYANHFPIVELDTSFYAIPSHKNILSWLQKTPESFTFLPKVYNQMTLHKPFYPDYPSMDDVFEAYKAAFKPMVENERVTSFLFQFPPFFDCTRKNVNYLKYVRLHMDELPVAVEFRNQTWFSESTKEKTLQLLRQLSFTHVVVDQPQTPNNSVPIVVETTHSDLSILRLHGRNYEGWLGENVEDWRAERTLYDYSDSELNTFKVTVDRLNKTAKKVCIIFNNNSGGHAAKNAKRLQELLHLDFGYLGPQQMDLFR